MRNQLTHIYIVDINRQKIYILGPLGPLFSMNNDRCVKHLTHFH